MLQVDCAHNGRQKQDKLSAWDRRRTLYEPGLLNQIALLFARSRLLSHWGRCSHSQIANAKHAQRALSSYPGDSKKHLVPANRFCWHQTHRFDLPLVRMIAIVPRCSIEPRMIWAPHNFGRRVAIADEALQTIHSATLSSREML